MKINYWITNAILSMGLLVGASTAQARISFDDLNYFFVADIRNLGNSGNLEHQVKSNLIISQSEREELEQLRQDKQIRDRVQAEVDRTFNRAIIFIIFGGLFIILFPLGIVIAAWLFQRSKTRQLSSPKQSELETELFLLPTEITDDLTREINFLKEEMAKIKYEFAEQINQLQAIYLDIRGENAKIREDLAKYAENNQIIEYGNEQQNWVQQKIEDQTGINLSSEVRNLPEIEAKANDSVSEQEYNANSDTEASASIDVNPVLSADDYLNQGNAHLAEGLYIEANQCYNQAVKIDRNFAEARYQNARAYAMRGSINPAIGNLQWAIDIDLKYKEMAKSDAAFNYIRHDEQFKEVVKEE